MFLTPSISLLIITGLTTLAVSAHAITTEPTLPAEIVSAAAGIQKEKSRLKRLELLSGMIGDIKNRVQNLPGSIPESDIPRVQMLYELDILFGTMRPEKINPASCPELQRSVRDWVNPSAAADSDISPSGQLVLDVVKSVCAP